MFLKRKFLKNTVTIGILLGLCGANSFALANAEVTIDDEKKAFEQSVVLPTQAASENTTDKNKATSNKIDAPSEDKVIEQDTKTNSSDKELTKKVSENTTNNNTEVASKAKKDKKNKKPAPVYPTTIYCDKLYFDDKTGNLHAEGAVKVVRGPETVYTENLDGNYHTGDLWLHDGGRLIDPLNNLYGDKVSYNYNDKTGRIENLNGRSKVEYITAEFADLYPSRINATNATVSRCSAKKPDYHIQADRVDIWPGDKMVAYNMKVFIKGQKIYQQDRYMTRLDKKDTLFPQIGYTRDDGLEIRQTLSRPLGPNTNLMVDLAYYTKRNFRPAGVLTHNEKNYYVTALSGYYRDDDDNWINKAYDVTWAYKTKPVGNLPLSYNFSFNYAQWEDDWKRSNNSTSSFNLYHNPIHLQKDKSLVLNLGVGYSYKTFTYGDVKQNNISYNAGLSKKFSNVFSAYVAYYHNSNTTNTIFSYNSIDMNEELQFGGQIKLTDRDYVRYVHRYDIKNKQNFDRDISWLHQMHCASIEFQYRIDRSEFSVIYNLANVFGFQQKSKVGPTR